MSKNNLFDNTQIAFQLKSDSELERAYFLFKMISHEPLVRIGTAATNFALKAHLPVEGLIRSTVFDHFCGGVNEEDCLPVIDKMFEKGVSSVLDYSVEGQEIEGSFDAALEKTLKIINFADEKKAMPIAVFKPTGFGRLHLYQKKSEGKPFTNTEEQEWSRVVARYHKVCKLAKEKDVEVLIDAEETWTQEAVDSLVEEMMRTYNTGVPIVYNTLQLYRWDRLDYLKELHKRANKGGFSLGIKIVRGAYMEKERERAIERGYPSPICDSKEATDDVFSGHSFQYESTWALNTTSVALIVGPSLPGTTSSLYQSWIGMPLTLYLNGPRVDSNSTRRIVFASVSMSFSSNLPTFLSAAANRRGPS
jgi:proline dehydrogenase